jgi:3-dehydroquinate synthetase/nucleoside-diphosphate-sugar epimerase
LLSNPLADDLDHILSHTGGIWEPLRGRRLLITGGTGFIGRWLLESFAAANDCCNLGAAAVVLTRDPAAFRRKAPGLASRADIQFLTGDVRDFAFPPGPFSHVIHAATEASATLNDHHPLVMWDTIVAGTRRVLEFAQSAGARRFLLASSGAVYGRQSPNTSHVAEDDRGAPDTTDHRSAYGEGKRAAELLCTLYARQDSLEPVIARCFAFVGPHLPLDIHYAAGNFLRDALAGGPIRIGGDGTPFRSYLYAADLAVWLWTILFRAPARRAYNVGSEEAVSIAELAATVARLFDPEPRVEIARPASGAPPERYVPNCARARAELSLEQRISLSEAFRRMAIWHGAVSHGERRGVSPPVDASQPAGLRRAARLRLVHNLKGEQAMQSFVVKSGQGDYPVEFHADLSSLTGRLAPTGKAVVVVDQVVAGLYAAALAPLTERFPTLKIDAGEDEKTLAGAGRVCAWLQEQNATKQTTLVAIGGGITQDVCAFTAHVYYRGLRWAYVPTTLLAMSDSCIGAKCCINHGSFKNQLGAFHSPAQVHVCTSFLATLAGDAIASGYGEILKLMYTGSREHFARLEASVRQGGLRNAELSQRIHDSLIVKKGVIEVDEYETGLRRILNYGHTFGHALEGLTDHEVPHGLAVAWGMDLVNYLALRRGLLGEADFQAVHEFIRAYLPFRLSRPLSAPDLIRYARRDKKVADGQVNLILAKGPGSLHVVKTPFDAHLEQAITEYVTSHDVWADGPTGRAAA